MEIERARCTRKFLFGGLVLALPWLAHGAAAEERFLTNPLEGFHRVADDLPADESYFTVAFAPEGETANDWSELVTRMRFNALAGTPPLDFIASLVAVMQDTCADVESFLVVEGEEHTLPMMVVTGSCAQSTITGRDEAFLFKAISGRDALYVVQINAEGPLDDAFRQRWIPYVANARVCPEGSPDPECQ